MDAFDFMCALCVCRVGGAVLLISVNKIFSLNDIHTEILVEV